MKILLVDDDPVARSIHSRLLRIYGHEVLEAADGELAWCMVEKENINFVVSDWMMPHLAGVDLCRRIRAANLEHYIYVILCTARGEKADLVEGMDAGADDFLVKPISPEELRVKVRAGERVLNLEQRLGDKNRELEGINSRLQSAYQLIENDLKAAAWMQQRLLPAPSPQALGVKCEWQLQPSSYIAGDIFNFFAVDEHQVGFYLLDVSGHGVPAAMLSVTLSMVLTPDATHGSPLKRYDRATGTFDAVSPADAIVELNRRFQSKDDQYFTMLYGLLDTRSLVLRMAQAGHPSPILIRQGKELRILGEGGMPVGLWPEIDFDSFEVQMDRGDRLLLYSDGVTECASQTGELFGEERLMEYLKRVADYPLDAIPAGLHKEISAWRGMADPGDDVSLLAIEMA
jgi:sigma-B regulation protein RsbU (phosphoserine phosphatase)